MTITIDAVKLAEYNEEMDESLTVEAIQPAIQAAVNKVAKTVIDQASERFDMRYRRCCEYNEFSELLIDDYDFTKAVIAALEKAAGAIDD